MSCDCDLICLWVLQTGKLAVVALFCAGFGRCLSLPSGGCTTPVLISLWLLSRSLCLLAILSSVFCSSHLPIPVAIFSRWVWRDPLLFVLSTFFQDYRQYKGATRFFLVCDEAVAVAIFPAFAIIFELFRSIILVFALVLTTLALRQFRGC